MIVCQRLAGGRGVVRGVAGGGEVIELGRGLRGLVHDVLGYGACTSENAVSITKRQTGRARMSIPLATVL